MKLSDITNMVDSVFCIVPTDSVQFPEMFYLASDDGIRNLFQDAIELLHIEKKTGAQYREFAARFFSEIDRAETQKDLFFVNEVLAPSGFMIRIFPLDAHYVAKKMKFGLE